MKNKILIFLMMGSLLVTSCSEDQLEITNDNQPDFLQVYASGDDVYNVVSGLYNTFYSAQASVSGIGPMLATAADNASCSWGNFAMRDMSWEPRKSWTNTPGYPYQNNTKYHFDRMYASINTASLALKAMNNGLDIGKDGVNNDLVKAFARFNMGIAYGSLALNFDQAFIVDEEISIENATTGDSSSYTEVAAQALKYLDEAISLSNNSFTIPASWMGSQGDLTNVELKAYANSWAARIISGLPRNTTENSSVNWSKVLSYANNGITSDMNVILDGYNQWYNSLTDYLTYPGWGVIDMYVINKLDPTMPDHWTDSPTFPAPPESTNPNADKRISTDYKYVPSNWLRSDRGYYHWSNYRYSRYDDIYALGTGPAPQFLLAENELYIAEALAHNGDLAGAAAKINAGTRVARGNLPEVTANLSDIMEAIHHERVVELPFSSTGLQFYEMRKNNLLQKGTPLHLPLPARTLETFGDPQPFYTFGGPDGADGVNGSNGGWR